MLTAFQIDAFQSCAFQEEAAAGTPGPSYTKVGGDDVPRVEVWEKARKWKNKDEALESTIKAAYLKLTGQEPAPVVVARVKEEIPAQKIEEVVVARDYAAELAFTEWLSAQIAAELDDEEALLLLI